MKVCCTCKIEKPLEAFGKCAPNRDGLKKNCKPCHNAFNKAYRERNPEKSAAASSNWAKNNPDKIAAKRKRWEERNPERAKSLPKIWRAKNKERHEENNRRYCSQSHVRIHRSISERLRNILKGKSKRTFEYFDFTREDLISHLEKQFSKGMTWENFGQWHIDHITPLSSFEISGEDDPNLKSAWCLSNLRPLWAEDNLRKRAKILFLV